MSDISAIITTHNRANVLPRAIESVRQQTCPPAEIIVVDDGSSDGTREWLNRQPGITAVTHQESRGISAARNSGIARAQGDWLAFLDDDDTWLPNKLEMQLQALQRAADEYRLCHSDEIWIRHGKRVNAMDKHRKHGGWIYPNCLPLCVISPSAVMLQRDVFRDVGMFDTGLPACEDYDLWLRICAREPVLYIEQPLIAKYGGHQDQLSRKYWGMDRFRIRALEKILSENVLSDRDRQLTLKTLIDKMNIYIQGARKRDKQQEVTDYLQRLHTYQMQLNENQPDYAVSC